jgi:hypothetical protein
MLQDDVSDSLKGQWRRCQRVLGVLKLEAWHKNECSARENGMMMACLEGTRGSVN